MSEPLRVMWLLNHTTLRKFELPQMMASGVQEIFLPKSFHYDEGNLSANVDHSWDSSLTIPADDLALLNAQDWYGDPAPEAWEVANKYFKIAIIGFFPAQIKASTRHFKGAIVMRAFGLNKTTSYSQLLYQELGHHGVKRLRDLDDRFWFGMGYDHLKDIEDDFVAQRSCFLPVGLSIGEQLPEWTGANGKIMFVCPRISSSPYFGNIYQSFKRDFAGFDYLIGGAQPLPVQDPKVIGFVTADEHARNMRECRVMFYHSQEPNHIHYHPFEAIKAGMPLVFMAGGMLDRLGGRNLPGRAETIEEARRKIRLLMKGDRSFTKAILETQSVLLDPMRAENCAPAWQEGFSRILASLEHAPAVDVSEHPKRIAVIVPVGYRGGSLRGAKLLAEALHLGAQQQGTQAEIILAHLDDPESYPDAEFHDLHPAVKRRPYKWRLLNSVEARQSMKYAGYAAWNPAAAVYMVPDDGMNHFYDCDLWIIISDRLEHPLLPLRPYACMVYDYLQRYQCLLPHGADQPFLNAARQAEQVFVTTRFTEQDALQYAGLPRDKVVRLPMIAPRFVPAAPDSEKTDEVNYFIWTTNAAIHKNHRHAFMALQRYYEMGGRLECHVTGVGTENLLEHDTGHLAPLKTMVAHSKVLQEKVVLLGELPDQSYQAVLENAAFLWHAGRIDNGTFSVVEAAHMGVPALSSAYPAMREIDDQFGLSMAWSDPNDPADMAARLMEMEQSYRERAQLLPDKATLDVRDVSFYASDYWRAVKKCL